MDSIFYIVLAISLIEQIFCWSPDVITKSYITYDNGKLPTFFGNSSDHFKLLDRDDNTLLIGARNAVYNISLVNGMLENQNQRIDWHSSDAHRELCALKGKQDQDCQNYIRVFARTSNNKMMICGTNSYKPSCRYYNYVPSNHTYAYETQVEAQGRCPHNPQHNSTYVYTDGQLYSATVADFSGTDALIYRGTQRTNQYDDKQLNQPAFVSAIEFNGYVLFFFREIAVETQNCGKKIFSRVGRVCKNDKGGPSPFQDKWTTYLKSRLNCSIPGEYPFHFDEIQATTQVVDGVYGGERDLLIYTIMTTPKNSIGGSAICVFSMKDLLDTFEGAFKHQSNSESIWKPVPSQIVPTERPGRCVDDSRTLPKATVSFVKDHPLMDKAVNTIHERPLLTRVSLQYRLSAIAVDSQVKALDGKLYDVIFIGTNDGKVIKFVNILSPDSKKEINSVIISEMQALDLGTKINEMIISKKTNSLIVISNGKIVSLPLSNCGDFNRCRLCMNLQDPYCVWDNVNHECKHFDSSMPLQQPIASFSQNIDGKNIGNICKKYDNNSNWIEKKTVETEETNSVHQHPHNDQPQKTPSSQSSSSGEIEAKKILVIQSTRGTVSSIGSPIDISNEISMTSIDGSELTNHINSNTYYQKTDPLIKEQPISSADIGWNVLVLIIVAAVVIGVLIGGLVTKTVIKKQPFHGLEHRNQLNWNSQTKNLTALAANRTSGKDVNLLMNTTNQNQYLMTQQQQLTQQLQQYHQNNKKDNLDFDCKDRSVECKNSTESLDKEVCKIGTGTLQKVKKTYI